MNFKLNSPSSPSGDQPEAIDQLCAALSQGVQDVTLLGVTGSGKTFTMANVIQRLQRPALILSHNKTLAAQLYGEFKAFFPENAVEYFVSYYDYYQPEAYIPTTDTYIEKDLSINDKIDELRVSAASALMSGRRDVIVISSVSCLYGIGNPDDFHDQTVTVHKGERMSMTRLLYKIVDALYYRTETDFKRGSFRVRGDTVDIFLGGADYAARIEFFGDEVDRIALIDPVTGAIFEEMEKIDLYPAKNFVTSKEKGAKAVSQIQDDLVKQVEYFESIGKYLEAKRLKQRVEYDIEMIKEMGWCPGDGLSAEQMRLAKEARPDTQFLFFPSRTSSTSDGWRRSHDNVAVRKAFKNWWNVTAFDSIDAVQYREGATIYETYPQDN